MPGFSAAAPLYYYCIPEAERETRCELTSDICVVDDEFFFVRACLEIPVHDADEPFIWGVWCSLSRTNFDEYLRCLDSPGRGEVGPYFGWLSAALQTYPDTENLKTMVHPRAPGERPWVELEPTDHPLAVEQREGISVERVAEIYAAYMHGET
jgi:hypothetical protein